MDILYNLIYKSGLITNQIRTIAKIAAYKKYEDRDVYVMARSSGTIINLILTPSWVN